MARCSQENRASLKTHISIQFTAVSCSNVSNGNSNNFDDFLQIIVADYQVMKKIRIAPCIILYYDL